MVTEKGLLDWMAAQFLTFSGSEKSTVLSRSLVMMHSVDIYAAISVVEVGPKPSRNAPLQQWSRVIHIKKTTEPHLSIIR